MTTTGSKRINLLDIAKWNKDRLEAEARIRELKVLIRTEDKPVIIWGDDPRGGRGYVNTGKIYRGANDNQAQEIYKLKAKLTGLYQLRAYMRGRQHQRFQASVSHLGKRTKPITAEQEAKWATELLGEYLIVTYQAVGT